MTPRFTIILAIAALAPVLATAQENSIPMPAAGAAGTYDPQLTAHEAALSSWSLAASGIGAGRYVSDGVVAAAGADPAELADRAARAMDTLLIRYSAARWVMDDDSGVVPLDPALLARAACDDCTADDLVAAFRDLSDALARTEAQAEALAEARAALGDRALMTLTLDRLAAFLDSPAWYEDLTLTAAGRDGEEVSARIVGALAAWRKIEPYVGLTDQDIDDAINDAMNGLMREVRRRSRGAAVMSADGAEVAAIAVPAAALAVEFRRAADLFEG